jgi:hypothetical protein
MIAPITAFSHPAMKIVQRLLLLGFIIAPAGCMGWQRMSPPAPAPDASAPPGMVGVTTIHGATVELTSVVVTADSVVGLRANGPWVGDRLALHRSQVRHFEEPGVDVKETTLLTGVLAAWAVLALAAGALLFAVVNSG